MIREHSIFLPHSGIQVEFSELDPSPSVNEHVEISPNGDAIKVGENGYVNYKANSLAYWLANWRSPDDNSIRFTCISKDE